MRWSQPSHDRDAHPRPEPVGRASLPGWAFESLLDAVNPADPIILLAGTTLVLLIGLLGAFMPALRATRVDPVAALRTEN